MTRALPKEVTIAGRRYDIITLPHVYKHGRELDALACHDSRHVWISLSAPPTVRLAALEQACHEGELMALTAGPMETVA